MPNENVSTCGHTHGVFVKLRQKQQQHIHPKKSIIPRLWLTPISKRGCGGHMEMGQQHTHERPENSQYTNKTQSKAQLHRRPPSFLLIFSVFPIFLSQGGVEHMSGWPWAPQGQSVRPLGREHSVGPAHLLREHFLLRESCCCITEFMVYFRMVSFISLSLFLLPDLVNKRNGIRK